MGNVTLHTTDVNSIHPVWSGLDGVLRFGNTCPTAQLLVEVMDNDFAFPFFPSIDEEIFIFAPNSTVGEGEVAFTASDIVDKTTRLCLSQTCASFLTFTVAFVDPANRDCAVSEWGAWSACKCVCSSLDRRARAGNGRSTRG